MDFGSIMIAVVAAGIGGFVTGAVWYTVLSKPWMAASGVSEEDAKPTPFLMINALICQFVMAFVLVGIIWHLNKGEGDIQDALITGAFCWLGFVLTTQMVNHRFQGRPWSLTFIDCGHWLAVLLVQSLIIGFVGS